MRFPTESRKDGFQPLPAALVRRPRSFAEVGIAAKLYSKLRKRTDERTVIPDPPLLHAPTHTAREMYKDLRAAGIKKSSREGKLDFHSLRVAYIAFVCEAGATVKEAQEVARHSTPQLTLDTYARARGPRLAELVEKVAETAMPLGGNDSWTLTGHHCLPSFIGVLPPNAPVLIPRS